MEYPLDYASARERFRELAGRLGWNQHAYPIDSTGPDGLNLTVDVGISNGDAERVLVVSSGLHGVEGFFGSAVQLAFLEQWATTGEPATRCVFLHALNPYGFAWLRRPDENNVDPNRNFLLKGEKYDGAPAAYARLDSFLNPRRPPSRLEWFPLQAISPIMRYGLPTLRQTIAGGQYEFPKGLFYGGTGPSRLHQILSEHLGHWLQGAQSVVHLDFHTGLGRKGAWKLLLDYEPQSHQRTWLTETFGAGSFATVESHGMAYHARGSLGQWCVSRNLAPHYLYALAEFGTYSAIKVLAGLRAENQAHYWGTPAAASTLRAKERLKQLFWPTSEAWRSRAVKQGIALVDRAVGRMIKTPP